MAKSFKIGDWVYINRHGHAWHGKRLRITGQEQYTDLFCDELTYKLDADGAGSVLLTAEYLSYERPEFRGHIGHEIVENTVLGKNFLYCRKCKVEVP